MNPHFAIKATMPDDSRLRESLGASEAVRLEIVAFLQQAFGPVLTEWKYYGKNSGWVQKYRIGKRNAFFLLPGSGGFRLSFTLREKSVLAMRDAKLPVAVIRAFEEAKPYAEGRTVVFEVSSISDSDWVKSLILLKLA
ncbi:MAG: DUF3788 family protein [Opitutales bacterium]|nr:DUF3788 family protein [Opitutales bacterium]